jgi:fumarate hydratase subunit beta
MKNIIEITTPLGIKEIVNLRAGDFVNITGNIYAARDAAHKRFFELIEKGEKLPNTLQQ